jgi:solute carrier family 35, member F1/2
MIVRLTGLQQGVLVCICGLGMLAGSDSLTDKNIAATHRGKGDAFMVVGATLYGFSE